MNEPSLGPRPTIRLHDRIAVWAAAAGRCTFCNCLVAESASLGEDVHIGELAHNVGWTTSSPRGDSELTSEERRSAQNLLLVCGNCHKPIDDGGVVGRYSVDELNKRKREHENRIRLLTSIGAERAAYVIRMVGRIRGTPPELTRNTVLAAATSTGIYPQRLPDRHWEDIELDLRNFGEQTTRADFERCLPAIDELARRVHDGVRREAIERVAIFAIARIPLLIALGARLDDKLQTIIFQRHRRDDDNAWRWLANPAHPPEFDVIHHQDAANHQQVALVICLSGTIQPEELPAEIVASRSIYYITPSAHYQAGPTIIDSIAALSNFEQVVRQFLAQVENEHGKLAHIDLFPAVPISAAVTLGRVLMRDVSPAWRVFDRDERNQFFAALEIQP